MTNKEKYPNTEINRFSETQYYILLSRKPDRYLVHGISRGICGLEGCFATKEQAQTALDNFMNGPKQEITLSEIKSQLEEAKKLIGKNVQSKENKEWKGTVNKVSSYLDKEDIPSGEQSASVRAFYQEHGYVIVMKYDNWMCCPHSGLEVQKTVSVKAHDGQTYTAESDGDCWKFGCARINKSLIKEAYDLFDKTYGGNRKVEKITIGKCDFDRETLKSLVELENS